MKICGLVTHVTIPSSQVLGIKDYYTNVIFFYYCNLEIWRFILLRLSFPEHVMFFND